MPSEQRETTCVLVRDGARALVLDAGSGLRRLVDEPTLLDGVARLDVVLTHFHLDHVCGLAYTPALPLRPTLWAPGRWLYDTPVLGGGPVVALPGLRGAAVRRVGQHGPRVGRGVTGSPRT
jgi:glyoxylase-like metal-dependent hydrolase (beta-lactamase superfamily II)